MDKIPSPSLQFSREFSNSPTGARIPPIRESLATYRPILPKIRRDIARNAEPSSSLVDIVPAGIPRSEIDRTL